MSDINNETPVAPVDSKTKKPVTVAEGMDQRRIFASLDDMVAYLTKCATDFSDFGDMTLVLKGADEDGNFDSEVYSNGMVPMVSVLKNREKDGPSKVKAIIVTPVPTLDALLAIPAGRDWVQDKIDTQLNHVAVRALREAADVSTVEDQVPLTLEAFISSSRGGGSGMMETFNALFEGLGAAFKKKFPSWAKTRILKADLKKACESKAYAMEWFSTLEDRGEGKDSLFVMFCQLGIHQAKKAGLDPAIFDKWLANRDAAKLADSADEDEADSFDDLLAELTPADGANTESEEASA